MKGSQPSTLIKGRFRTLLVANPIDAACRSHGPKGAPQQSVGCQVRRVLEAWSIGHGPLTKYIYIWLMGRATEMCVCVRGWNVLQILISTDASSRWWYIWWMLTISWEANVWYQHTWTGPSPCYFFIPAYWCHKAGGDAMKCTGNLLRKNWVQDGKKNVQLLYESSLIFLVNKWRNSVHGTTNWNRALLTVLFFSNHTWKRCDTVLRKQAWRGGWFCTGTFFCCLQRAEWTTKSKPTPRSLHVCEPPKDWAKDKLLDCEVFGLPQSWLEIFGIVGTWKFWWKVAQVAFQDTALLHNHWSCPYCLLANLAKP